MDALSDLAENHMTRNLVQEEALKSTYCLESFHGFEAWSSRGSSGIVTPGRARLSAKVRSSVLNTFWGGSHPCRATKYGKGVLLAIGTAR